MHVALVNLAHGYDSQSVLFEDLSIDFPPNSATALMGPSGSGKSTLLSILGQVLEPCSGQLIVDGVDRSAASSDFARGGQIGWIFQQSNLLPRHTALYNVAMGPMSIGRHFDDAKVLARDALKKVGLSAVADAPCRLLSGGEAQRVGVARTLASDPVLLLADEPTGQLDAVTGRHIVDLLLERNRDGRLSIIATHDQAVADRCDRTVLLRKDQRSGP